MISHPQRQGLGLGGLVDVDKLLLCLVAWFGVLVANKKPNAYVEQKPSRKHPLYVWDIQQ